MSDPLTDPPPPINHVPVIPLGNPPDLPAEPTDSGVAEMNEAVKPGESPELTNPTEEIKPGVIRDAPEL